MTARLVTIQGEILNLVAATFSSAKRIWNPYELELTPSPILQNGYGVTIGPMTNPNKLQCGTLMPTRLLAVTLTREVPSETEADNRVAIEQEMFEDQLALIKAFEANSGLVGQAKTLSDNGTEYLTIPDLAGKYFVLTTTFEIIYEESLT